MSIAVTCTHCAESYSLPENILGKRVQCAACRETFEALADAPPPGTFATCCSYCGKWFAAPDHLLDRSTRCRSCGQVFVAAVPAAAAPVDVGALFGSSATTYRPPRPTKKAKAAKTTRKKASNFAFAAGRHPALQIGIGIGLGGLGVILTMISFMNPNPNGQFTIFYGLMIIGLLTAGSGVFRLMGGRVD